jgi:hypothetical protein
MRLVLFGWCLLMFFPAYAQRPKGADAEKWAQQMEETFELYVRNVRYQKEHLPWVDLHFGIGGLAPAPLSFGSNSDILPNELLRSWMWKFGTGMNYRFDGTPWVIQYGMRVSVHRLGLPEHMGIINTPDGRDFGRLHPEASGVQLVAAYIYLPLMFHLDFSKYGMGNGFRIGLGGVVGYRVNGYQRFSAPDSGGEIMRYKVSGDHGINDFRYGLLMQMGLKSYQLSLGYDLNDFLAGVGETPAHYAYFLLGIEL